MERTGAGDLYVIRRLKSIYTYTRMENILDQYRDHLSPIVYDCLEQLYVKIKENNDLLTYYTWKELLRLLILKDMAITSAFRIHMHQLKEEYKIIITNMFIKYEINPLHRNRS